ncbi:MAG TPA: DUF1572 family protein [Planctomycetaceae bacterium]
MDRDDALTRAFTSYATGRLGDCLSNVERCVGLLTAEQVWHRPNEASNSVGNLVLHLTGNVRQWIVAGLGGEPFDRDRPAEFAERGPLPTERILPPLRQTVERACDVIGGLTPEALLREYPIQGRTVTGLAATFHVVEHFSFHTGQVVSITKLLTGRDLSLYDAQGRRVAPLRGGSV